jgi:phage internal scaffolding protein
MVKLSDVMPDSVKSIRKRVYTPVGDFSLTEQHHKDTCDITRIMAKYNKTGLVTHVRDFAGQYGDFLGIQDFQTSMNQVVAAQSMFDSLPSGIRSRFRNSAAEFLDFASDEKNISEMREMGLLPPDMVSEPLSDSPEAVS